MFTLSTSSSNVLTTTQFVNTDNKKMMNPATKTSSSSSARRRSSFVVKTRAQAFNTKNSEKIFKEAQDLLPGGVNSPVRAFKSVGGQPIVFDRVKGPCKNVVVYYYWFYPFCFLF